MEASLRHSLTIWLLLVILAVWGMVIIGGLTRLSDSGLSIVEWKPISGILPPLSAEGWQAEFTHYQKSPQYQKINKGMSLEEFKGIFWLEYWHRLAGRIIGLLFLLPLLYFSIRHHLPRWLLVRLGSVFVLGGLQGALGWYMVKSGLVDVPMVSPFRLAAHLGMAFLIIGILVWTVLQLNRPMGTATKASRFAGWLAALVFVQVLLGALVAGLDAGLTYNTFPLMDGQIIPGGLYAMQPWWINHFENVAMVQFQHRLGAYVLAACMVAFAALAWRQCISAHARMLLLALIGVFLLQFALGVLTLLHHVPMVLASKHQAVAAILFAICLWLCYDLRAKMPQDMPETATMDTQPTRNDDEVVKVT